MYPWKVAMNQLHSTASWRAAHRGQSVAKRAGEWTSGGDTTASHFSFSAKKSFQIFVSFFKIGFSPMAAARDRTG